MPGPDPSTCARLSLLLCVAWGALAFASAPTLAVQPGLGTPERVRVAGRLLERPGRGSSVLSRNLRTLTAAGIPEMPVEVRVEGARARVTTGADGTFAAELLAPEGSRFVPGVLTAWVQSNGTLAAVPVTVLDPLAPFVLVSDFDDTLAMSHVRTPRRLVGAALFRDGLTQPAVPGMAGFYRCLLRDKATRPGLVVLSGSPAAWAPRLRTLLLREGFPTAALVLRPSLQSATGLHKREALDWLARAQPAPLLLVGDSGEKDPEIYAEFRAAHPDRVLAVYIRDAGGPLDEERLKGAVPFGSAAEAAADAAARGWVTQDCVASEVVRAVP